jgi:hypothetical protein
MLMLGGELGCELGTLLTLGFALGRKVGTLLTLGTALGVELGMLLIVGAALVAALGLDCGAGLGALLALGAALEVGCEMVVATGSVGGKPASWHVPSRFRLSSELAQFLLQHCGSLKQLPPKTFRKHSSGTGISRVNCRMTDLQFLSKRNPAHSPLQQWELIIHFCPTPLFVAHSLPLSSLLGSYPPNRRALDSLETARRETIIRVKVDVIFMFLVHLLLYCCLKLQGAFHHIVASVLVHGPFETIKRHHFIRFND